MKRTVLALAMVACCGCQGGEPDATGQTPATAHEAAGPMPALVNRVWARSDSTGLPGVMRVFLSDGTLLMDSCWETYQLARWQAESDSVVSWQEGPAEVRATVLELDSEHLVLRVALVNGSQEERYRPARVPYLCPDMRR